MLPRLSFAVMLLALCPCISLLLPSSQAASLHDTAAASATAGSRDTESLLHNRAAPREKRQVGGGLGPVDILILVCHNLQLRVPICQNVPPYSDNVREIVSRWSYFRTKRSSSNFFNTNYDPFANFPHHSSSSSIFDHHDFGSSSSSFWNKENVTCPEQRNQSAVYQLSANATDYPAIEIATELANDAALFNSLSRTIVLENTPPELRTDDIMSVSNATCPFLQQRLFSYFSVNANTSCFVLQNFQENVLYRECLNSTAINCQQEKKDDVWDFNTFSYWGHPNQIMNVTRNVNRCLAEFERVSLWSYCPALTAGSRIVFDRIIVSKACLPFSVPCQVTRTNPW